MSCLGSGECCSLQPPCCFTQIEVGVSGKLRWLDLGGDLLTHWQVTLAVGWQLSWGCATVYVDLLELLVRWSLGSERERPKNKSPTGQDVNAVGPLRGHACTLHTVTSAGPTMMGFSSCSLLQDHIVEKLVGWEIFLWPTLGNLICRRGTVLRFYT